MAADIGLKIGIDGEREYRKQLQQINAESRAFKSELKELESEFDSNSSAMDKNRKKGALLEKGIKDQEDLRRKFERNAEVEKRSCQSEDRTEQYAFGTGEDSETAF